VAKKILTVDDSATMRRLIRMSLVHAGYEVVEAEDGVEALEKSRKEAFDLVLSDVNMPKMNGLDLVRNLRKTSLYRFTPILLITTESLLERKQEGKAAGATGWIVKPFEPEELLAVVAKVLR
jgi:two-component system chemotaxis response regulator CheY